MNMSPPRTLFLFAAMFAACYPCLTMATNYTVGNDAGWSIPADTSYYQKWASGKTFVVGDTLNFKWTETHSVANVTETDYTACTKVNSVVGDSSPVQVELKMSGEHYYICTIGLHCSLGMKLAISVEASTTNSTTPTTTSPTAPSNPSSASSMSLNYFFVHVLSVGYYCSILLVLCM